MNLELKKEPIIEIDRVGSFSYPTEVLKSGFHNVEIVHWQRNEDEILWVFELVDDSMFNGRQVMYLTGSDLLMVNSTERLISTVLQEDYKNCEDQLDRCLNKFVNVHVSKMTDSWPIDNCIMGNYPAINCVTLFRESNLCDKEEDEKTVALLAMRTVYEVISNNYSMALSAAKSLTQYIMLLTKDRDSIGSIEMEILRETIENDYNLDDIWSVEN